MADFSEKSFNDLKLNLEILYGKAEELMLNDSALESIKSILSQINQVCSGGVCVLKKSRPSFGGADDLLEKLHEGKAMFDLKTTAWLERWNVDPKTTASIVSAPRSVRFLAKSGHIGYRSKVSGGSSHSLATAVANEQKARLRMRQLEEKRFLLQKAADFCHQQEWEEADLRRKRKREEADLLHETEMLETLHELQAATVERLVLLEKLENGGFSSGGDDNEEALDRLSKVHLRARYCATSSICPL